SAVFDDWISRWSPRLAILNSRSMGARGRGKAHLHLLELEVDAATLASRTAALPDLTHNAHGTGRELFGLFRANASTAEAGASPLFS
ncbi:MAG: hypothetical protein ACK40L_04695, partial [Hydrogenophaga sp.]